jgi:exodeoxyribonuclease VII small subunit
MSTDSANPGYAHALTELDSILRELESSDVDVDRLADRVARAAELISLCRERISAARIRIDEVIADLDGGDSSEATKEPSREARRRFVAMPTSMSEASRTTRP